jgi:cytoskeletal protein RodZ
MKPTYAVVLGITLGISSAITLGMSSLGFLMAFIATAAFWWGLILYRRTLNKHAGGQANARAQQQISRHTEKATHTTTRHAKSAASKVSGSPMMGASTIWAAGRSTFSKDKPAKAAENKQPEHAQNGTGPPASPSAAQSNGASASPPSAREQDGGWQVSGHATREYAPPPAAAGATDAKPAATKADPAVAPPARTPVSAGRDRSKELRFRPRRRDK